MGTGWAVASSTLLGISVGLVVATAAGPGIPLIGLSLAPAIAGWAYALATAAHGSRTALLSLTAYAIASVAWALKVIRQFGPAWAWIPGLVVVLGAITIVSLVREARARRGPIHVGALAASLALLVISGVAAWFIATRVIGPEL